MTLKPDARRFSYALALSASVHVLALWQLPLWQPEHEPDLPVLQAKLEPLPAPAAAPQPSPPKTKPRKPKAPAPTTAPESLPALATVDTAPVTVPEAALPEPQPASAVVAAEPAPVPEPTAPLAQEPPPLPKRALLKYQVRITEDGLTVGDVRHQLEITEGRYTLTATIRTVGLARLVKNVLYNQVSRGSVTAAGFQPDYAQEDKNLDGRNQNIEMFFDRASHVLRFSLGGETELPDNAQDRLSLLYQLSRLRLREEYLPLAVTNGRKLERYQVEIGQEEDIITPMGRLRTLPVRKIRAPDEEGLEIWLALEYRLLPVKVVRTDRTGAANGVIEIQEIRLSDE